MDMEARQPSHRRSIPTKEPQGRLGQTAAAPRSILKARLYRMTASFTEQMVNLYIHLGMLSSRTFFRPLFFFVTLTKVRVQL